MFPYMGAPPPYPATLTEKIEVLCYRTFSWKIVEHRGNQDACSSMFRDITPVPANTGALPPLP